MAAKKPSKVKQAASRMKAKLQAAKANKPKGLMAKAKAAKKAARVDPIPRGYHSATPSLTVRGAAAAIGFYQRAFGAKELSRMTSPDGSAIWHAQIKIGDSIIHVADEMPGMGVPAPSDQNPAPGDVFLYLKDADQLFNQAVGAGAKVIMPMAEQFWGDRMGQLRDPYGYTWTLARRVKILTPRQMKEAGEAWAAQQGGAGSDGGGQVASGPQAIPDQPTPNDLPSGAI